MQQRIRQAEAAEAAKQKAAADAAAAEKARLSRKTHSTWEESMRNVDAPSGGGTTRRHTGHGKSGMGRSADRFAAQGGYMRRGYSRGGRVGILSVF